MSNTSFILSSLFSLMLAAFPMQAVANDIDIYQNSDSSDVSINYDVGPGAIDLDLRQLGSQNSIDMSIRSSVNAHILQNANHSSIDLMVLGSIGLLDISQSGNSNQIDTDVSNNVSLINVDQSGDDNLLDVEIDNALDSLTIGQSGSNNKIHFQHSGYGGSSFFIQGGFDNSLDVITSSGGLSVNVTQQGSGSSVKITNGFESL